MAIPIIIKRKRSGGAIGIDTPVIVGSTTIGSQLSISPSYGVGTTYQWKRDGVNIDGATSNTYTITISDLNTTITVTVSLGDLSATSDGVSISIESSQAQAYLDRGTALTYSIPNAANQILTKKFFKILIDTTSLDSVNTNYSQIDAAWLFKNNGDHDFASLNLISPTQFECTENGTLTYTQDSGFTGSTNGYLNTGWIASTHASKYTANTCSIFFYVYNNENGGTSRVFGAANSGNTNRIECLLRATDETFNPIINASTVTGIYQIVKASGFYHIVKTSSTNIDVYRNGVKIFSGSITTTSLPNVAMYVLARNANGTAGSFSTQKIGCLGFASHYLDPTVLYSAWTTYSGLSPYLDLVMKSSNGTSWTTKQASTDNQWKNVASSSTAIIAVAENANGSNNRLMRSTDGGETWTTLLYGGNNKWIDIAYSADLDQWCAVALSGTNRVITSDDDGVTWTARTTIDTQSWVSIDWSPDLLQWCAVSETVSANNIMVSSDGITWTGKTNPVGNALHGIKWCGGFSTPKWVAAPLSGNVLTSTDGDTWTQQTTAENNSWTDVDYSPVLNLAVMCANSGTHRIQTSSDGVTWTYRNITTAAYRAVKWFTAGNKFVTVAQDALITISVATSADGITWASSSASSNSRWDGLCEFDGEMIAVALDSN